MNSAASTDVKVPAPTPKKITNCISISPGCYKELNAALGRKKRIFWQFDHDAFKMSFDGAFKRDY